MHKNLENGKVYKLITIITCIKVDRYQGQCICPVHDKTTKQKQQAFMWILKICKDNKIKSNKKYSKSMKLKSMKKQQ